MSLLDNKDDEPLPLIREFSGKDSNLGDMWSSLEEKYQNYWNIYRPAYPVPQTPAVGGPSAEPPPPGTGERVAHDAVNKLLKGLSDICKCCFIKVQQPAWLEPTATSIRIDKKTNLCVGPVELPPGSYMTGPAPFKNVLCLQIPDLMVGVIWGIAQLLEDDDDFDVVEWREVRNGAVLVDGQYCFQKANPTRMHRDMEPVPIILPPLSTFCLQARNILLAGEPKHATARITGHMIPVKDLSGDGAFSEFCVT